jgi:PadR family transcriptional regulator, regulatory protein PadR
MPKGDYLGELELLVLSAVHRLGDDAYGMTVRREIEHRTGRDASIGAVYSALERLEGKGLLRARLSDPLPIQGGRARKHVQLTPAGLTALRTTTAALARMLDLGLGVPNT